MKLIIIALLQQKINYLLNRFDIEWSGPAWFTFEKSEETGFPMVWKLNHFLPLDLGSHSETEWSSKHFMSISRKLYEKHPELKDMYQGNIHSHHTMGAFFSGTDKELLRDGANDVGYPSLVVANGGKESHAFAISYLDQFRQPHIFEAKTIDAEYDEVTEEDWIKEANKIEKRYNKDKKKRSIVSTHDGNQMSVWTGNRNNYHLQNFGLTMSECVGLDYWEKDKARQIHEAGGVPRVSNGRVIAMHPEEVQSLGVTDAQVKHELEKADTPKERFEIAIDAHETGFMDEADFQREIELLGAKYTPEAVEQIHTDLRIERSLDDDDLDTWNNSFTTC